MCTLRWLKLAGFIRMPLVAKTMAYIINELGGDFQRGGFLYKPTSGIQWTPEHSWTSDRPQKQASEKADQSTFGSQWCFDNQLAYIDRAIDWWWKMFFAIVCSLYGLFWQIRSHSYVLAILWLGQWNWTKLAYEKFTSYILHICCIITND